MGNKVLLSIIILNYRSEEFCHQCLESIRKNPPSFPYEVILVDNHSDDSGLFHLKKIWADALPIRFYLLPKNLGYGKGNTYGVEQSSGDYIAIMNPDIEAEQGTFDGLQAYLEEKKDVGLVAPKLFFPDGTIQDSFRRFPRISDLFIKRTRLLRRLFPKKMKRFLMWDVELSRETDVDWVVGAFFVMRKKAWDDAGGFDPRYFLFLEDTDLCRTLWEKKWRVVFHPKYEAKHHHARLSGSGGIIDFFRKKTLRIHFSSAIRYYFKWFGKKNPR